MQRNRADRSACFSHPQLAIGGFDNLRDLADMNPGWLKRPGSFGQEDDRVFRSYPQSSSPIKVNRTRSSPVKVPLAPDLLPPVVLEPHQAIFPTSPDRTRFILGQGIDVASRNAIGRSIVHGMAVPQKTNCA